jgi:hypothetical protein
VGGVPTSAGQQVPLVTFTFTFNQKVTANPTAVGFNEALLIADEPNSATHPTRPVLNCGAPGAPDNGSGGPGACAIISTGDPADSYDGTANGYGAAAVCDGVGHPAANTYTCGRPNVFQGRSVLGAPNVVQFTVPFDTVGPDGYRVFRLTNVRVNATSFQASGLVLPNVFATLSLSPNTVAALNSPTVAVASVLPGMMHIANDGDATKAESRLTSPILLREVFATAWLARNISSISGDNLGTLGNATYNNFQLTYNGGTRNPADVAQNVPGTNYNTESGFTWQNNGPNGPPSPNPPPPWNFFNVSAAGGPLASAGFGGIDTGISAAGVAQAGTRIAIRFTNIPPGGSVTVPTSVQFAQFGQVAPTTGPTGVMALTATDANGAGAYTPRSGTFTANDSLAVYEVLFGDVNRQEEVNIPFTLAGFPDGVQLRGLMSYAPFYSTSNAGLANAALPEPRFMDLCGRLQCVTVFPASGRAGDMVNAAITVNPSLSNDAAAQMLNGVEVKLVKNGQPDIPGIPALVSGRTVSTTFNLAGATVGPRDVVVTPTAGSPIALAGGFNITQAPPCSYTVGPTTLNLSGAGGSGSLVVSPVPVDCPWSASTTSTWITLGAKQGQVQPYTIEPNPFTGSRFDVISIAGKTVDVTQQGACTYQVTLDPANKALPTAGGIVTVSIAAPAGCQWSSFVSTIDFMHATSPTSGAGNGVITFAMDSNSGSTRQGVFTVTAGATQTYSISQSASDCGIGTDVSTQVLVTRGAILSNFTGTRYTQQVTIKNTSATPLANLYLTLESLTSQVAVPANSNVFSCRGPGYLISPTLAPGQSVTLNFQFAPGKSTGGLPPTYSTRVLSF